MIDAIADIVDYVADNYDYDYDAIAEYIHSNYGEDFDESSFVDDFFEIMDAVGIDIVDNIHYEIDYYVDNYDTSLEILEQSNYYSGWDTLAANYGGYFENINQLAYAILDELFYDDCHELISKIYAKLPLDQ